MSGDTSRKEYPNIDDVMDEKIRLVSQRRTSPLIEEEFWSVRTIGRWFGQWYLLEVCVVEDELPKTLDKKDVLTIRDVLASYNKVTVYGWHTGWFFPSLVYMDTLPIEIFRRGMESRL